MRWLRMRENAIPLKEMTLSPSESNKILSFIDTSNISVDSVCSSVPCSKLITLVEAINSNWNNWMIGFEFLNFLCFCFRCFITLMASDTQHGARIHNVHWKCSWLIYGKHKFDLVHAEDRSTGYIYILYYLLIFYIKHHHDTLEKKVWKSDLWR